MVKRNDIDQIVRAAACPFCQMRETFDLSWTSVTELDHATGEARVGYALVVECRNCGMRAHRTFEGVEVT